MREMNSWLEVLVPSQFKEVCIFVEMINRRVFGFSCGHYQDLLAKGGCSNDFKCAPSCSPHSQPLSFLGS